MRGARRSKLMPPFRYSPTLGLRVAAMVLLLTWLSLAWLSRAGWLDGWRLIGILGWGWLWWWIAWRTVHTNRATLTSPESWLWMLAFRAAGLVAVPILEDDFYRFLWDGRQFALTGNPYDTPPDAHFGDPAVPEPFQAVLDQINYPHLPTIYGPVCQIFFALSYWIAPAEIWPLKFLLLLAEVWIWRWLTTLAPPGRVLIFSWCPLAVFEIAFNAHPDVLGIGLAVAAIIAAARPREWAAGALLGVAVSAKVFAVLLVPFVLRRAGWRGWVTFAMAGAAPYLPFWLQGSSADWAGLRAFSTAWEFNSSLFALLQLGLGSALARVIAPACALALLGWLWWQTRKGRGPPLLPSDGETPAELQRRPSQGAERWTVPGDLIFGVFLAFSAVVNPWYLLWLLPFIAVRPTAWGITALAAVSLSYLYGANIGQPELGFQHPPWLRPLEYGLVAGAISLHCWRTWNRRRERLS